MQIRCTHCHKPYALNKETIRTALVQLHSEDQNHYNASCPHCRRNNRVSLEELERAFPGWETTNSEED